MPDIQIIDNGATFKIVKDSFSRLVAKAQVREIAVMQTNFVKLDLGLGALHNVYLDHRIVSVPNTADPEALRDELNSWMAGGSVTVEGGSVTVAGGATLAKQNEQITELGDIQQLLIDVKSKQDSQQEALDSLHIKLGDLETQLDGANVISSKSLMLETPLMVDESAPESVIKGYAAPGSLPNENVWALLQISVNEGITISKWANGSITFENRWDDRNSLSYERE